MLEQRYDCIVCGIDEVGRGPLAGPVVASCVYIPEQKRRKHFLRDVNDSKKLPAKAREVLYESIREHCLYGIGVVTSEEIDTFNIHHATLLAMSRAYEALHNDFGIRPEVALVDGRFKPKIPCNCEAITKGDSISITIAAASIFAKVTRDRMMARLHEEFPYYGWERNAGYGTPEHLAGIKIYGVTPHHRRSFAPVREALQA